MTIDSFSYFDKAHPSRMEAGGLYIVAPEPGRDAMGMTSTALPKSIAGGLLPLIGLDDGVFEAAVQSRFWRGLLMEPSRGGQLYDAVALARIKQVQHAVIVVDSGFEGFSRPHHLASFLASVPDRTVMLTHGGQLNISGQHLDAARALFEAYPMTLLETSGIYRQDFLEDCLKALGAERILYGSGHPKMDERLEVERVRLLGRVGGDLDLMLGGNAHRIFDLDAAARGAES